MDPVHRVHPGGPIPAFEPDAESGFVIDTRICANDRCTAERMHLFCAPARVVDDGGVELDGQNGVHLSWNGALGALEGDAAPELAAWLTASAEFLTERWTRMAAQREDELYTLRAPSTTTRSIARRRR